MDREKYLHSEIRDPGKILTLAVSSSSSSRERARPRDSNARSVALRSVSRLTPICRSNFLIPDPELPDQVALPIARACSCKFKACWTRKLML
jgi:hypothetical protein